MENKNFDKNCCVGANGIQGLRSSMEDRHSIQVLMKGHQNWSFFAVFDGHAGFHSAEFCETALLAEMEEKLKVL